VTRGSPLVSIVIPTHNRALQLRQTLSALAAQTFPHALMEVIVVADGCSDDTLRLMRENTRLYRQGIGGLLRTFEQPELGPAAARNLGARHAAGRILIFLDDDVEASPWACRLAHPRARQTLRTGRDWLLAAGPAAENRFLQHRAARLVGNDVREDALAGTPLHIR
jgi:glycosyltransferase involved in cell wall biosynthesis